MTVSILVGKAGAKSTVKELTWVGDGDPLLRALHVLVPFIQKILNFGLNSVGCLFVFVPGLHTAVMVGCHNVITDLFSQLCPEGVGPFWDSFHFKLLCDVVSVIDDAGSAGQTVPFHLLH